MKLRTAIVYVVLLAIGLCAGYLLPRAPSDADEHTVWQANAVDTNLQWYEWCLTSLRKEFAHTQTLGGPNERALVLFSGGAQCARAAGIDAIGDKDIRAFAGFKCCPQYLPGGMPPKEAARK